MPRDAQYRNPMRSTHTMDMRSYQDECQLLLKPKLLVVWARELTTVPTSIGSDCCMGWTARYESRWKPQTFYL